MRLQDGTAAIHKICNIKTEHVRESICMTGLQRVIHGTIHPYGSKHPNFYFVGSFVNLRYMSNVTQIWIMWLFSSAVTIESNYILQFE